MAAGAASVRAARDRAGRAVRRRRRLARLGAGGLEEIIEVELTEHEQTQLRKSAAAVEELVKVMGI